MIDVTNYEVRQVQVQDMKLVECLNLNLGHSAGEALANRGEGKIDMI